MRLATSLTRPASLKWRLKLSPDELLQRHEQVSATRLACGPLHLLSGQANKTEGRAEIKGFMANGPDITAYYL